MRNNKKAISPVVATVLLISLIIVMALIIFLWFRSAGKEEMTKFDKDITEACKEVKLSKSYSGGYLDITNVGEIPIFDIKAQYSGDEKTLRELSNEWPANGLNPRKEFSGKLSFGNANKITLIPVLLGDSENGRKTYSCDKERRSVDV